MPPPTGYGSDPPGATLNLTRVDNDGYELTVMWVNHLTYKPSHMVWWISDMNGSGRSAHNIFPTSSGYSGSTSDNNITVAWFDNDNDGEMSKNDTIRIYNNSIDLEWCMFRLYWSENPIDDWSDARQLVDKIGLHHI